MKTLKNHISKKQKQHLSRVKSKVLEHEFHKIHPPKPDKEKHLNHQSILIKNTQ
jgi:hypothetical protein